MLVKNTTKGIITAAIDHRGTLVVPMYPGWNEVADADWFPTTVKLTEKRDIEGFGDSVVWGLEPKLKGRIESGELVLEGEAKVEKGAPRRGLTLQDLSEHRATAIVEETNSSKLLAAWKTKADKQLWTAIASRELALKKAMSGEVDKA